MGYCDDAAFRMAIARERYQNDGDRQAYMQRIRDYYQGDQINEEYMPRLSVRETTDKYQRRLDHSVCTNLTAHVANSLGMTLKKAPKYTFDKVPKAIADAVMELISDDFFNLQLQEADIMTSLMGSIHAQPAYDMDTRKLKVTWWYPDFVQVKQSANDPLRVDELRISSYQANTPGSAKLDSTWIYTREYITPPDSGRIDNPYAVIQFIQWRDSLDPCYYWPVGIGERLVRINHAINLTLSDIMQACLYQGFSVMKIKGNSQNIEVGPQGMIELGVDENADAQYITPDAKILDMIEAVKFQVQLAYSMFGLKSQDPLRIALDASSGTAILMSKADAFEYREKRAVMLRRYIDQTIRMLMHVYAVEKGIKFDAATADIQIDIAPPDVPIPSSEKIETDRFALEIGTISPVDIFLRDHPGWEREEAIEELVKIAAEREQIQSRSAQLRIANAGKTPGAAVIPPGIIAGVNRQRMIPDTEPLA